MSTLNVIAIRDAAALAGDGKGGGAFYSSAKEKTANRGAVYSCRSPILRWLRQPIGAAKFNTLVIVCTICSVVFFSPKIGSLMGWNLDPSSSVSSPSRGGYTVLINTWKRNSLLKQSIVHYASCRGTDAIHVVWSENDPPSEKLRAYLEKIVLSKSLKAHKANFRFDLNKEDNLNNRFKPIEKLRTDAIFSVDDDVIVPCATLDFAFSVWQTAPSTMVGFVPRTHWLAEEEILSKGEHIIIEDEAGPFGSNGSLIGNSSSAQQMGTSKETFTPTGKNETQMNIMK
ncbi:hypothetical protein Ancab_008883 [Ancistrocladus abbreviatus]